MENNTGSKNASKAGMDKLKYEVANELGVPLKDGYNGDLTSAQNGSVGGEMVNIIYPEQHKEFRRRVGMMNMPPMTINITYSVVVE